MRAPLDPGSRYRIRTKLACTVILVGFSVGINEIYDGSRAFRDWYGMTGYPFLSRIQRILTGWCPFSLGDILYIFAGVGLLFYLVRLGKALWRKRGKAVFRLSLDGVNGLLLIYLVFICIWGLNYRSFRTEKDFRVYPQQYSVSELSQLGAWLLENTNRYHRMVDGSAEDTTALHLLPEEVFAGARQAYLASEASQPGMVYRHPSVKPSMFGYLMNFIGVSGYYNPFTGEAQVNTAIPQLLQPYVCCHEMAHQLGFAPEESANFVGYVAAMHSNNPVFRYSANFDLMLYALGELRFRDSVAEKALWATLDTGVKKDYGIIRTFYRQFSNPVDPLMSRMYDRFLRANHETEGIYSYDEVIGLLIQYYRKIPR